MHHRLAVIVVYIVTKICVYINPFCFDVSKLSPNYLSHSSLSQVTHKYLNKTDTSASCSFRQKKIFMWRYRYHLTYVRGPYCKSNKSASATMAASQYILSTWLWQLMLSSIQYCSNFCRECSQWSLVIIWQYEESEEVNCHSVVSHHIPQRIVR